MSWLVAGLTAALIGLVARVGIALADRLLWREHVRSRGAALIGIQDDSLVLVQAPLVDEHRTWWPALR